MQRLGGVAHSGVIEIEWAGDSNSESAFPSVVTLYRVEGENRFGTDVYTVGQPTPTRTTFSADATDLELRAFYYDGSTPGEVFTFKVSGDDSPVHTPWVMAAPSWGYSPGRSGRCKVPCTSGACLVAHGRGHPSEHVSVCSLEGYICDPMRCVAMRQQRHLQRCGQNGVQLHMPSRVCR
jgi:hypothetical protein